MASEASVFARIRRTVELSAGGLGLILVTGEDDLGYESLEEIWRHLPVGRPVLRVRLEPDFDLVDAIAKSARPDPIVLVLGLERAAPSDRQKLEDAVNLQRDRFSALCAAIVLWVPKSEILQFQRHCADLFHWRSLFVEINAEDLPLTAGPVSRRRFLAAQVGRWAQEMDLRLIASTPIRQLSRWSAHTHRGYAFAPAGAGKTAAFRLLRHEMALESLSDLFQVVVPYFLPASRLREVAGSQPFRLPGTGFPVDRWAESGNLCILIDDLRGSQEEQDALALLCRRFPKMRLLANGREKALALPDGWERMRLEPVAKGTASSEVSVEDAEKVLLEIVDRERALLASSLPMPATEQILEALGEVAVASLRKGSIPADRLGQFGFLDGTPEFLRRTALLVSYEESQGSGASKHSEQRVRFAATPPFLLCAAKALAARGPRDAARVLSASLLHPRYWAVASALVDLWRRRSSWAAEELVRALIEDERSPLVERTARLLGLGRSSRLNLGNDVLVLARHRLESLPGGTRDAERVRLVAELATYSRELDSRHDGHS